MAMANNPRTWASRAVALAAVPALVNGGDGGIGIELGELGDGRAIGGIDLDSCRAKSGSLQPWAIEIVERFGTYAEISPSLTGLKLFFFWPASDAEKLRSAMGGQFGKAWKRGSGAGHPPAIELYLANRYFTITRDKLPQAPRELTQVPTTLLLELIHSIGPRFVGVKVDGKASTKGRSEKAFAAGARVRREGGTFDDMIAALLNHPDPDVAAWAAQKGQTANGREFRRIWDRAASPDDETHDAEAEIARLAALPLLRYAKARADAAKALGIPVGLLDKLVNAERPAGRADTQGEVLEFPDPDRWPNPVDGFDLICDIRDLLHRHIVLSPGAGWVIAVWCLHSFLLGITEHTPRLAVVSPERGCGKTTLLDLVGRLVYRPLLASNLSAAATYRVIARHLPTLIVDEADTFLRDNEELRGVLNAGHRYDGFVLRVVGEDMEPRRFSVFGPMAIALIGSLPGTLADRSITVRMRRAGTADAVERIANPTHDAAATIVRKAHRWAEDHRAALTGADPKIPDRMWNRVANNWRPLFAIAEAIGGQMPAKLIEAAETLIAQGAMDPQTTGVMLLQDIRQVFKAKRDIDSLTSAELVRELHGIEERPWGAFGKAGKPITTNRLADVLRQFAVMSTNIRVGDQVLKGYLRNSFEDAWSRYLTA
jgi:putative DNA primase/helicase